MPPLTQLVALVHSRLMKIQCTWLLAAAVASSALQIKAELANAIKAIVHDSVITYVDVEDLTMQTADALRRQSRSQAELLKKIDEARGENLEKLLARQLILQDFKTAGYHLPESVIDELVQERIHAKYGNRVTLTKSLEAEGLTYEKFRQQIREQFIVEALRQKNISSEIIISPHKVENYYLAHKAEDEVKLRMIVLNKTTDPNKPEPKKLAEEIVGKLNNGVPFEEMANEMAQPSQRNPGAEWYDVAQLRKELVEDATRLKPGERSGIIETPEAYYLMRVEDKKVAHTKSLGDVRDQIEKSLLLEERNRLEKQWIERLKKKTFVRYFP